MDVEAADNSGETLEEDDEYNTFLYWKLPVLDLEMTLQEEHINANLATINVMVFYYYGYSDFLRGVKSLNVR